MNNARLWTKSYLLNCIISFFANLAYYLTMVVVTDYASKKLHASLPESGLACGIIILGVLFSRLAIGRSIEAIGTKKALCIGLGIFIISTLLNLNTQSIQFLFVIRFIQGIGFGAASTASGTIMAQLVPSERRGEGTSYFAMFITLSTAIGPFLGIFVYHDGALNNNLLLSGAILFIGFVIAMFLEVPHIELPKEPQRGMKRLSLGSFFEIKALPIAVLTFFMSIGFASLLGFMTSYVSEIDLLEVGRYFFIIYAMSAVISRPITGRLFDQKGDNIVLVPSFIIFALGLYLLGTAHSSYALLLAGACIGLGFGTYMSCAQAIAIRVSPRHRMGLATSTYFIFMDLGVGLGPLLLGLLIPFLHFRGMYVVLGLVILVCTAPYLLWHERQKRLPDNA